MNVQQHNWYNANSTRKYPLSDLATGLDDQQVPLPNDAIADLQLRWPRALGLYAFIGGITITNNIVTVVILAAESPTSVSDFTPLAAITVPQPVVSHRMYNVQPLSAGVAGFVVFGDTREFVASRFSTPQQTLLLPGLAQSYAPLPVQTLRKERRFDGLTGVIGLRAGTDIEMRYEQLEIDGLIRDAIVVGLQGDIDGQTVLDKYIGPCGGRPESKTCSREGVETINGVSPDCDGNIRVQFRGFTTGPYESCGAGVTLDQNVGIDQVCVTDRLSKVRAIDLCYESITSSLSSESLPSVSLSEPSFSISSSSIACETLPFQDCFDDPIHHSWVIRFGNYSLENCDT